MWMNMGYWENTLDFPTACRALLDEVLKTAKLLTPESRSLFSNPNRALTIVDLGFGCGDQTVYLIQKMSKAIPAVDALTDKQRFPLMDRYVGVTPNRTQFQYAESRLTAFGMHRRKDASPSVQIFCADAAQPASWSEKLSSAAKGEAASPSPPRDVNESATLGDSDSRETWILALDTLYHFSPSRQPILNHAYRELQASLMAFDLVLAEDASRLDRVLLMVVSILTGTPFANFVTAAQYRKMLVSAGYAEDGIEVRDVSGHVFAPLARFLKNRERQLGLIGLGIGAYRVARWMFGWWGKSGAVRGVIVIARR
ncbi:hypothetical protein H2201_006365 [Coniosporium apollinis]|uniref:Methyltransferase domain-containing protein n=1 Tax=Coniosporium apollinis TaxID=61459 RepID=A0ABQ9NN28_9PEZI|nr:hypothetical protein H2201_006365 [Coniosporium apollinis]